MAVNIPASAQTSIGKYIINYIQSHEYGTQYDLASDHPQNVTKQYVSLAIERLERDGIVICLGRISRRKYYVMANNTTTTLASIRRIVTNGNGTRSNRPTIWMGQKLSPTQFLTKFANYKPPFGDASDEWDFIRDIQPQMYALMFGKRGHHTEQELIDARGILADYIEALRKTANFIEHYADNHFIADGEAALALADITVLNYVSRHVHEREIA